MNDNKLNESPHVCSSNFDQFKCGSLNVCGLKRRIQYPDFCELVGKYDIFCVNETKLDDFDTINIDGYDFLSQCRKQAYIRKSGGIGVFIKQTISSYVSIVESDSDYVMWFKISKTLFKTDEDILFGAVYVPPSDSRFNNADEIDMFEIEVINTCILYKYVFLLGDFNARTYTSPDYIDADDFFMEHFDFDNVINDFFNVSTSLSNNNLSKERCSKDTHINNEGNKLLEICKSNNLLILNGRCGEDKDVGNFTFRNISVIDYSIVSVEALKYIEDFCISELDCLYTDGHSLLTTTLTFKSPNKDINKNTSKQDKIKRPIWKDNKREQFVQNIDETKIASINTAIQSALQNLSNVNKETINNFCVNISNIFVESSDKSFSSNQNPNFISTNKTSNKPWFGFRCQNARKKYHIAKNCTI